MSVRKHSFTLIVLLIAIAPLVYLAITWHSIPEIVPMHYDSNYKPDRMDNKSSLWLGCGILSAASLLVYFLMINLPRIDPKRRGKAPSVTFKKLALVIACFMSAINMVIILSATKNEELVKRILFPLIGFMFAFIGNYMSNLKPNYFTGIRLPWTLSSDYNWKKTHQLAGKLWFFGGLFAALVSLLVPFQIASGTTFGIVAILVIIPCVYSYKLLKKKTLIKIIFELFTFFSEEFANHKLSLKLRV